MTANTPENRVKREVKTAVRDLNIYYMMPVTGGFGHSGDPDFFLCVGGLLVGVETKSDCLRHRRGDVYRGRRIQAGAPTDLQKVRMGEIRAAGGLTLVVDRHNVGALRGWLERALDISGSNYPLPHIREILREAARSANLWYEVMPND